ncbi:hypothetical protein RB195_007238 [Necator americanus]|uniref:DUF1758 domain-containing protein n=2 Tax=Necator americanus TaxID=51031 RepID=A0ABR1BYS2_NECAM
MCTPITLFNPDEPLRRIRTTAFFDCGASITMIKKQIATDLNLKIEEEQPLSLQTFRNDEDQIHPSSRTTVGLLLENDDSIMLKVRTLSFLTQPMQMGLAKDHIRVDMPACSTTTQREKLPNRYDLVHTRLGNIISGKPLHTHQFAMALSCIDTLDNPIQHHKLEELLQKFWSLESVGIIDDVSQSDGERCLQKFNDTVCFSPEEGRYMVRLPSKEDTSQLLVNFNMATSRLRGPVLLPEIAGILTRIRFMNILIIGDIEKAFLMVETSRVFYGFEILHLEYRRATSSRTPSRKYLLELRLPRKLHLGDSKNLCYELHVFTDAPRIAYSAVAFLVTYEDKTKKNASLLMSKSRLASLQAAATIPRLELSALPIGAKLTNFLKTQINTPIQKCYIWSDSKVALQWSKCEKSLPVFINNRVNTTRTNAPSDILRYVPSNLNAADIGSKGIAVKDLLHSE